jgi:hypothetical protein
MGYALVKGKGKAFGSVSFWRHVDRDILMLLLYRRILEIQHKKRCAFLEIAVVLIFDTIPCSGRYAVHDDCIDHWCLLVFAHRAISEPCPCVIYPSGNI